MRIFTKIIAIAATVSMTFIASTHAARAGELAGTLRPFACGKSTAEVIEAGGEIEISDSGKAISLASEPGADSGLVISDFPEKNILRDSIYISNIHPPFHAYALRIVLDAHATVKDKIVVRMCFKPQLGLPGLISVDVPLKNFTRDPSRPGFFTQAETIYLATARACRIFANYL
jgi:hypothetical protein